MMNAINKLFLVLKNNFAAPLISCTSRYAKFYGICIVEASTMSR